jgi:hypothetical protein
LIYRLERLDIDRVPVRGRRAIGVMVVAAAALVLSGSAFLHAGAKPSRLAPPASLPATSRPTVPDAESMASRLQPMTISGAEAAARQAGLPLIKPAWLPFQSSPSDGPRQVQELHDSNGRLFMIITVYYGPDGQTLAVTQQFEAVPLSLPGLEGTVTSSPVPWARSGGNLSLAWKDSGGRYLFVEGTGLTEDQLRRIAASMS